MNCPACHHANPERAKFCLECGAPIAPRCASCGTELPPAAKFCLECGTPVVARGSQAAGGGAQRAAGERSQRDERDSSRKIVSILFADLVGSTALHERLDAEAVRRFMDAYYAAARAAVEAHGGVVTQLLGDGVKAVFGEPRVAEDDAIRAVRAAVAMQEGFRALAQAQRAAVGETGLRVAVNTGEVVVSAGSEIIGDPVNVAARLQEKGRDGDVVIGGETQRVVARLVTLEKLGTFALKGRAEAVAAYRVVSLERPAGAAATAFVGRDAELARLRAVYDTACAAPATKLAVLLGSPGLGKSRLIDELARGLNDAATVITAHCDAAGGASFAPLARALREHLGVGATASNEATHAALEAVLPGDDAERKRIRSGIAALLAGTPASPEETFFVVRRLLAALAAERPLVLAIDDLHWAEPLLLDLVEHLVQWGGGVRLLVLVGARPELRELRSSLATPGGFVAEVVTLAGLDAGAAMKLAAGAIGADDLPSAVAAKLLLTSEGNPLFVGELARMLVADGVLEKRGERFALRAGVTELEMPPTIHALLAARIERLRPEERGVLEHAAAIGRTFSRGALAALLPAREAEAIDARLEALRRSELIERDPGWFLGEPGLRFHHVLIRDAAYRRVLKGTRAELHAKFAGWVEQRTGDAIEHDETIGWHYEQAHEHLRELGPLDARGIALGERAAARLAAAGRRALARDDVQLAGGLLGRALARLAASSPLRAELALDACEALLAAGAVGAASAVVEELGSLAGDDARLRAWHTCFRGQLLALTEPASLRETAGAVEQAAAQLTALGDAAGEAKAHYVHAQALSRLGRVGASEAALDHALAAARRAGDRRRANAVLAGAPLAALNGPSPVTRASGRCLDVVRVLRITQGAPAVEAMALSCQGLLEALRGRSDAARRMLASSRKMLEELGIASRLYDADVFAARVELLEGDAVAAERGLRGAFDGLRELGLGIDAARAGALLARALLAQGRAAEAEAISREAEALAGDDLQAAIAWRGVRAEALAQRGEHAEAIALAQAAVAIASATDALLDHADARVALAAVLRAAGRNDEADAEEQRARELWEAKGATRLAERARSEGARAEIAAPTAAAQPALSTASPRRVRPNAATRIAARIEAALNTRDLASFAALHTDDFAVVDHPNGLDGGHAEMLRTIELTAGYRDVRFRIEPHATLGESLALCRQTIEARGGANGRGADADVGEFRGESFFLQETDPAGRLSRLEVFGDNKLSDAIVRLYERYAESLPEGAARVRARSAARSNAAMATQPDAARRAVVFAPDIEVVDRRVLGTWNARGAEEALRHFGSMEAVAERATLRDHEVLALTPDALLVLRSNSGIERTSGGAYERRFLQLRLTGADGRIARIEWFDEERRAEALARFDALTAPTPRPPSVVRRVRANAALRNAERTQAAVVARDLAAARATFTDDLTLIHHPTGTTQGVTELMASFAALFEAARAQVHRTPLATLGDSLALTRQVFEIAGITLRDLDAGPVEIEQLLLLESGEDGRSRRGEAFAGDKLGDAIARLYERYAELQPVGPERERAAATARSFTRGIALSDAPAALSSWIESVADAAELIDHRVLGFGSLRGRVAIGQLLGAMVALEHFRVRADDVVRAEPNAILVHTTTLGTARAEGGAFDRQILHLWVCGDDGMVSHVEYFAAEQQADALARFDELTASSASLPTPQQLAEHPFANAASRALGRFVDAWRARDWAAVRATYHDAHAMDDRRKLFRVGIAGESFFANERLLFELPESEWRAELVATRGERLALCRVSFSARDQGSGPLEIEMLDLVEVDAAGKRTALVVFDADDEEAAFAELDLRFEAGEAAVLPRVLAARRSFARALAARDFAALRAAMRDDVSYRDHRTLGWGQFHGPELFVQMQRTLVELAPESTIRTLHLRAVERGYLHESVSYGVRDGGAFELAFVGVNELDEQGRQRAMEIWDVDKLDAALARFAELSSPAAKSPSAHFENAASRADAALFRCFNARDWAGVEALAAPSLVFDERRRLVRNSCGREVWLEQFRVLFDSPRSRFASELVATRGERLALNLHHFEAEVAGGGGALEMPEHLCVHEVDTGGRIVAIVLFDLEDRDAAYAELDARFEAGAGAASMRVNSAFVGAVARRDWDAVAALCSPAFIEHDHRRLAVLGTTHDAAAWARNFSTLVDLAPDTLYRIDHVRVGARGFWEVGTWHGQRDGGHYELPLVPVLELDDQQRIVRADLYDDDQLDAALARFAELSAPPAQPEPPFANAASRAVEREVRAFAARDWDDVVALFSPAVRFHDRRRMQHVEIGYEECLVQERLLFDQPASRWTEPLLATRGEFLSLHRVLFEAEVAGGGPLAFDEHLVLVEVDAAGRLIANVLFDLDAEDAAYAELDARFAAGEGAQHAHATAWAAEFQRSFAERDWAAMERLAASSEIAINHRLVGWGTLRGPTWVPTLKALVELAPDVRERIEHVRTCERGLFWSSVRRGTREGGEFETPWLFVVDLDEHGRQTRLDVWDADALPAALARFDEVRALAALPKSRFENAASRAWRSVMGAWRDRDAARFEQLQRGMARYRDHRRLFQLDLDREQFLAFTRPLLDMRDARDRIELLATRGERLALKRFTLETADGDVGASVIESLLLIETNSAGSIVEYQRWDVDGLAAAYAELDARFAEGEGHAHPLAHAVPTNYLRAFSARDWPAMTALFTSDLVAENHRLVGWGTLHGADAFVASMRAQIELAPDTQERVDHVRLAPRGALIEYAWHGTHEGGAFEILWTVGCALDARGRMRRVDVWEPEQLDAALAWFASLESTEPRDPRAAITQPNLASEWAQRFRAAFNSRDWAAVRALYAADATYDDRQRLSRLSGGLDLLLSSVRERASAGAFLERIELLGNAGSRLALHRFLWAGGGSAGRFEIEHLGLQEVNEAGLLVANVNFDLHDARAAQREMWARWAKHEPALALGLALFDRLIDAFNAHDAGAYRALLADDVVVDDHRLAGIGRIAGAAAYVGTVEALWALADSAVESSFMPASGPNALLVLLRRYGTLEDGGAHESEYLQIVAHARGRFTHVELFEVEHLAAALARFEELEELGRAAARDPLRIPPNAATRAFDRWYEAMRAGDFDAIRALTSPSHRAEERRQLRRLVYGHDEQIRNARWLHEGRWSATSTPLAIAGERLALYRVVWKSEDAASEIEMLEVDEIDREGRFCAAVTFDPDARAAASAELFDRYVQLGADGMPPAQIELLRAIAAHDPARMRAVLPDSYWVDDHRRLGLGRIERDDYVASFSALNELSRELRIDELYQVAVSPRARLAVARMAGLNAEGGAFETYAVWLSHIEDGELASSEYFDLEDLPAARARFEALNSDERR